MRSVFNIFKLSAEDPVSSHITKYTMNMKPSAFSDTRSKVCVKYNCFIVCKEMRQSFYLLKVIPSFLSLSCCFLFSIMLFSPSKISIYLVVSPLAIIMALTYSTSQEPIFYLQSLNLTFTEFRFLSPLSIELTSFLESTL